jgi:hypothetical protein
MKFEEVVAFLGRIKVEYSQDYDYGKKGGEERHRFDVPVFKSFRLPWEPITWMHLCSGGGEHYIGGCCGTTSAAQDVICHSFRFDEGWISTRDLAEMASLLANHDEPESPYRFSGMSEADILGAEAVWDEIDPWEQMAVVYHATKPYASTAVPLAPLGIKDPLEKAISTLGRGLQALSLHRMFTREEGPSNQDKMNKMLVVHRLLPDLKVLNESIEKLAPGVFEGYALVDLREGDTHVAENGRGLCLYATKEEVDEVMNIWREQEKEYEETTERAGKIDDRIGVRRVRVSADTGLEFLDEGKS